MSQDVSAPSAAAIDVRGLSRRFGTFVAVDERGRPRPAPQLVLETDLDRRRATSAVERREQRLRSRLVTKETF